MFDQMRNLKQIMGMLGNPQELQQKFQRIQDELARKTVEAEAGAGAVRVTVNGRMQVQDVQLDPTMIAALAGDGEQLDQEMIEQLVVSAVNAGLEKAQQLVREEFGAAGLNLPGMQNMLG